MSQQLTAMYDINRARIRDFFIDMRTGVIYFVKSVNNKKVKFSTKCKDLEKAKRYANKEFVKRYGREKTKVSSLIKDELKLWVRSKESGELAYDTLNNVKRAASQIEEFWGSKFPAEVTTDSVSDWYVFWREKHPDIEMENAIKYMRNFCKYLAAKVVDGRPLLPAIPAMRDPNYKKIRKARAKRKENILTAEDFQKIYYSAEKEEHKLVVLFMYTMGTRITETLTLRYEHEIFLGHTPPFYQWGVGQNKADLEGKHTLHKALIGPLERQWSLATDRASRYVFPQKLDINKPLREQIIDWDAWRKRAGVSFHWTPHTFRHTCLSNLFNDEKNPQALICKLYRVSLAVALETYVKPTESGREKMRNAIEVKL